MLRPLALALAAVIFVAAPALAQKAYAPGVSDSEIRIGQTMPYSGPAAGLGTVGRVIAAYVAMLNEAGVVNGRRLTLLSRDDGFDPARTLEETRALVEVEQVAFLFASAGSATNAAVRPYLNERKVPQLFIGSPFAGWSAPAAHPWSMALPWAPPHATEAGIHLRHLLAGNPKARIALLYQYDEASREYLTATREVLGVEMERLVVATAAITELGPALEQQIGKLAASGADALMLYNLAPAACVQAIRRVHAIGWKPARVLAGTCLRPEWLATNVGAEAATGLITLVSLKTLVAGFDADPGVLAYRAFLAKYAPGVEGGDFYADYGYTLAGALLAVLRQAGDTLTRENIMAEAANLKGVPLPLLLPGVTLATSPADYRPMTDGMLARFDGAAWVPFGEVLTGR